jgi:hypothetical protein
MALPLPELCLRLASALPKENAWARVIAKAPEIVPMHSPPSKAKRRFLPQKLTVISL